MEIKLTNIGKKFRNEWIFRNLNYQFTSGKRYAVVGHNGSGKSTLLQVIAGILPSNAGQLNFTDKEGEIALNDIFQYVSFSAPYMELIEEFTLEEAIDFHIKFKPFNESIDKGKFLELSYLAEHQHKPIRQFSSGMKQRLKLALSFFTQAELLFFDEPTTNLDETGIQWYLDKVSQLKSSKLVIISSNDKREYQFCDEVLDISQFKNKKLP